MKIITCTQSDLRFAWETEVMLDSYTKLGYDNILILVYDLNKNKYKPYWDKLQQRYSNCEIITFPPARQIKNFIPVYPPIIRPYMLEQYYRQHPEMTSTPIWYVDTDVILTKYIDFTPFLQDDINYLSYTGGRTCDNYIDHTHFENKYSKAISSKQEELNILDPLSKVAQMVGITKQTIIDNQPNTGGAQYLLKNLTADFWAKVMHDCLLLRIYLSDVNQKYMPGKTYQEKEDAGVQAWCSDMYSLLWNIWASGKETRCPKELDFTWNTDYKEKLETHPIFHNAGSGSWELIKDGETLTTFFKGDPRFANNELTPFDIPGELQKVSPSVASYTYTQHILSIEDPICKTIFN